LGIGLLGGWWFGGGGLKEFMVVGWTMMRVKIVLLGEALM
jgi:hypothetical protein